MSELNWWLEHGSGITLLVTFMGSAFVFVRGQSYKGAIAALKDVVEALQLKSDLQDEQIEDLTQKDETNTAKIKTLTEQNEVLLSQRPSNEILENMVQMIEMNHIEVLNMITTLYKNTEDKI